MICANPKCGNEFTPKNAKGIYCGPNCRSNHHYSLYGKNSKKSVQEQPKALEPAKKPVKASVKPVKKKAVAKPKVSGKPVQNAPKTLDELKSMCPHKSGLDRSAWIAENRVKYGL